MSLHELINEHLPVEISAMGTPAPRENPGKPEEKPEAEPEKLPKEDPGVKPEDPDEDDDDDEPWEEPEIGDDPDEIKRKTTVM